MPISEQLFDISNQSMNDAVTTHLEYNQTFTSDHLIDKLMSNVAKLHIRSDMTHEQKTLYKAGYLHAFLASLMDMHPDVLEVVVDRVNWQNQIIESKGF